MKLYEIKPLLQDMGRSKTKIDKFRFTYNHVTFEVIISTESKPFELLFGVVKHNFSFVLNLNNSYELDELPDEVFYKLCDILKQKPGKEGLTSYQFTKYVASKIPDKCSEKDVQPHEVAMYKRENVPEKDKIYFCGWKFYSNSKKNARNFEKTNEWLGTETCNFCRKHNISSCWTANKNKRKDYYSPKEYLDNRTEHHPL